MSRIELAGRRMAPDFAAMQVDCQVDLECTDSAVCRLLQSVETLSYSNYIKPMVHQRNWICPR